jgi:hypothetical protein
MNYTVIKAHQPVESKDWIASKGGMAIYEKKPTEYEGWLWCTNKEGKSAWAPEEWVEILKGDCRFKRDYNAIELTVQIGESVEGDIEVSGWIWVAKGKGVYGWVPRDCLK